MALLKANDPRFAGIPDRILSPFPSNDGLLSGKLQALNELGFNPLKDINLAEAIGTQAQAAAFHLATRVATRTKALIANDFLLNDLSKVSWLQDGVWQGLWSVASFPLSADPEKIFNAMIDIGFNVATEVLGAVPVAGQIIKAVISIGRFLANLFCKPKAEQEVAVPFAEYSKDTDEDLANAAAFLFGGYDWTPLWDIPMSTSTPWKLRITDKKTPPTYQYAPFAGNEPDYESGFGMMPGTLHMADRVQISQGAYTGRTGETGNGLSPWILTDCGKFFPTTAQLCSMAWEMVMKFGGVDMYKVDALRLISRWNDYFTNFFNSAWPAIVQTKDKMIQVLTSRVLSPYIFQGRGKDAVLGIPNMDRAMPYVPFVHRYMFSNGPGLPEDRHRCMFLLKKSDHSQVAYRFEKAIKPMFYCEAWPTEEEMNSYYGMVHEQAILPSLETLIDHQFKALERTIVCAYLRPDAIGDLPPHAALAASPELKAHCIDMQNLLLKHEARKLVNLKNVDEANPPYAQKLRDSGVTNSLAQMAEAKGLTDKLVPQEGLLIPGGRPPREPSPPQGGAPFEAEFARGGRGEGREPTNGSGRQGRESESGGSLLPLALGGVVAAGAATATFVYINRRPKKKIKKGISATKTQKRPGKAL